MQDKIGQYRRALSHLDELSRLHLSLFQRQVAFLLLFSTPALLVDQHRPVLFLCMLQKTFAFSAFIVSGLALLSGRALSTTSLCLWDHVAALLLLSLLCSIALRLLST